MNLFKRNIFYIILLFALTICAQEVPPIQVFTPQDYGAEDQNWAITQSQNNFIYITNNKGLLEYNGASWQLYDAKKDGVLRSVSVIGDRIYSGGYMDFGYWSKNTLGKLDYTSLVTSMDFSLLEDEVFWGIIDVEDYVLFQSFKRIYIYNTADQSYDIIDSDLRINKIFRVNESIYFQTIGEGVFEIENGKAQLIIPSDAIDGRELVNIYADDNGLLLQTKSYGFFSFQNAVVNKWNIDADNLLSNISVYSSKRLKDGSFVLGTISNGVIQLSDDGSVMLQIDQSHGLSNNTILSIKEDNNGNVWLGLDKGINVINLKAPYKVYKDEQGVLGTVYASEIVGNYLYLGTNQGLFYKALNVNEKFKFIQGTEGQVWNLKYLKETLFCGHDRGTFVINKDRAEQISSEIGTWDLKAISAAPNLLLQGNYIGLNVLENVNNRWRFRNKIEGFDISSRSFEFITSNEILMSHEYKGVYRIKIDDAFTKVENFKKLPIKEGFKSSVLNYNNSILYSFKSGVFHFNNETESFTKDSILSALFSGENYVSGKFSIDEEQNRLWGFTKNEIIFVEPGILSNEPKASAIEISNDIRQTKPGFEDILHIKDDTYLIGNTEGYIVVDLGKIQRKLDKIYLNSVSYTSLHNKFESVHTGQSIVLGNKNNSVRFGYSVPNYDTFYTSKYQYKLKGIYDDWSDWSTDSEALFENLPFGEYVFEARANTGGIPSVNTIYFKFTIEKPWYLRPLAFVLYVLIFLTLAFLVHYVNRRHYKKQQQMLISKKERELELEQLESQRQIMEFRNKNLRLDIDNKNRELGMATMNLVKRNELLNNIKGELSNSKSNNKIQDVVKLINSSLNNTSDWKLFEEAFNNVDKDFMKRIKTFHPSITPNDLRLCAYLRLNLSSKEIAPLLNISHKSVEVKRYRLRKKMGLDHDQSLSNYIIEL